MTEQDQEQRDAPNGGGRPMASDRPLWEEMGYLKAQVETLKATQTAQLNSFRAAQMAMSDTLEHEKEERIRLRAEHDAVKEESARNSASIARLEPLVHKIHAMLETFEGKLETLDGAFKELGPLIARMRQFFLQHDRRQKRLMGTAYTLITLVASTVVPKLVDFGTALSQHTVTTGLAALAAVILVLTFIPFGGGGGGTP